MSVLSAEQFRAQDLTKDNPNTYPAPLAGKVADVVQSTARKVEKALTRRREYDDV